MILFLSFVHHWKQFLRLSFVFFLFIAERLLIDVHFAKCLLKFVQMLHVQLQHFRLTEQLMTNLFDAFEMFFARDDLSVAIGELFQRRGQMIVAVRIFHDGFHQRSNGVDRRLRFRTNVCFGIFVGEGDRQTCHGRCHRSNDERMNDGGGPTERSGEEDARSMAARV